MAKLDLLASDRTYYSPVRINYFCTGQARKNIKVVKGDFTNWSMTSSVFSNMDLGDSVINKGSWSEIHFGALLISGKWKNLNLKDCSFDKGIFDFSTWNNISVKENTIFTGCSFKYVIFEGCNFEHVEFRDCTFSKCSFLNCTFEGVHSRLRPQLNVAVGFKRCLLEYNTWNNCNFKNNKDENGQIVCSIPTKYSTSFTRCTGNGNGLKFCKVLGLNLLNEDTQKLLPNVTGNCLPTLSASIVVPESNFPDTDEDDDGAYIQALMGRYPHNMGYSAYKPNYSPVPITPVIKNKWAFVFSTPGVNTNKKTKTGT